MIKLTKHISIIYIIKSLFLSSIVLIISCNKDRTIGPHKCYLHLSHTRTNSNLFMDNLSEMIDFNRFDMLWLGGDLALSTSSNNMTMDRINNMFNIEDRNTLWSLGNHDYADTERIENYTKRPPYYATYQNGITFIVLDTQDSLSNIVNNQKDFLFEVLDTIQQSNHLIILHHKLIWMYDHDVLESQISSVSNADLGGCFNCINPNNFYLEIYPNLIDISDRGIKVFCIGGDIGYNAKEFEYLTNEGIYLLASGINSKVDYNKAILFYHDLLNKKLTWSFEFLKDL